MSACRKHRFLLFVDGDSLLGRRALKNFQDIADGLFQNGYSLEVVDIFKSPERTEAFRVMAAPTLLLLAPMPQMRIVGDMRDREQFRKVLGKVSHEEEGAA